jgi:hypothetical protein
MVSGSSLPFEEVGHARSVAVASARRRGGDERGPPRVARRSPSTRATSASSARSRRLDLPGSRDTVRIDGRARADRFHLGAPRTESGKVTRLAYRYDVATVDGLLERARAASARAGHDARRTAPVEGTLVSSDGEWVVLRESAGRGAHARADGRPRTSHWRAHQPGTFTKPDARGRRRGAASPGGTNAELSYLTGGLGWSAEHVLVARGRQRARGRRT